ncbi:hypothetical protein EMIT0P171_190068 [Pseudomonas sp. IT-P171]
MFDRKQVAQAWIKRRETELAEPGAIARANRKGVTVKKMIEQYLDEYEKIHPLGKTKSATLNAIKDTWLGELGDSALTSQKLVEFAQWRMSKEGGGVQARGSNPYLRSSIAPAEAILMGATMTENDEIS